MTAILGIVMAFALFAIIVSAVKRRAELDRELDKQRQADTFLTRAESLILQNRLDAAEGMLGRALGMAGENSFLRSEAHYGLYQVHLRRDDLERALKSIDSALACSSAWELHRPEFKRLLERCQSDLRVHLGR